MKKKTGRLSDGGKRARGRFGVGNKAGRGREKGSRNLRTLVGAELVERLLRGGDGLPDVEARWRRLLREKSPRVRLEAERHLLGLAYGPPRPQGLLGVEAADGPVKFVLTFGDTPEPARESEDGNEPAPWLGLGLPGENGGT
jgi:hypothetical protein